MLRFSREPSLAMAPARTGRYQYPNLPRQADWIVPVGTMDDAISLRASSLEA